MTRTEPCVCGGLIVAAEEAPAPAVLAHNRSPRHVAWRMGLAIEDLRSGLPTPDGQPVQRVGPAEAFGGVA